MIVMMMMLIIIIITSSGDELRLQRLRDEMPGEAGAEGYDDDFGDDDDALGGEEMEIVAVPW